ncbi:MAG: polysaccharide deacetylase family protein [Thermoleophilia bacterium]
MKLTRVIAILVLTGASLAMALLLHGGTTSAASVFPFRKAITTGPAAASWGEPASRPLAFPGAPAPAVEARLPILMYHHIKDPAAEDSQLTRGLSVSPAAFETQMIHLQQQGFQTVSMEQLFAAMYLGEPLPAKPVLLTFDDGYADNYTLAAPILEKYGFSGTFFIITGMAGIEGYMTWDQVLDLEGRGMEIGSHTVAHPDLTVLGGADLERELAGSAATLNEKLGHPVYWLCYPSGEFNLGVMEHAWAAGYLAAVTTMPGNIVSSSHSMTLTRGRVGPGTTLEQFARLVE